MESSRFRARLIVQLHGNDERERVAEDIFYSTSSGNESAFNCALEILLLNSYLRPTYT